LWDLLGSTAERLLQQCELPVLIARSLQPGPPQAIIASVDTGELAAPIVAAARDLCGRFDARLMLLHVLDSQLAGRVRLLYRDAGADRYELDLRAAGREWLEGLARDAGLAAGDVAIELPLGSPSYEALVAAERFGADLIVIGASGSGEVANVLLGSVSRSVLRGATHSVLVVPAAAAS
jgi:nucleotide-binding universal stress UspA family protein